MKTYYLFRWCVYASLSAFLFLSVNVSYGQIAKCKGKYFGNIIANNTPANYTTNWNQVTMENASKWQSIEGTKGVYNFNGSDVGFNWAKNNGGLFKYHNLMWGAQTPGWVSSASTATIQAAIEPYFKAVADHYNPMGGLKLIDVLNEPINTAVASNLKNALTAGYQAEPANAADKNNQYGWAIWCFQLARKYFPNSTLLINEYNVEMNWNNCRAPYIAMSNAIKNAPNLTDGKKNLIDGVGLQCHGIDNLTAANFKACIDEIWTKTGLAVHITEFDQTANPNEAKQQSVYSSLIPVAWEHPHVAGITLWGYIQGQTWIGGNGQTGSSGTDSGIMYANGQDRPAMAWLRTYFSGRPSLSCCPAPAPFASCSTTNTPPTVSIAAPANNASFTAPASISITANAADVDGTVSTVQFYNGATLLGSDATSPYSFTWTSVAAGTYTLTAKATDNAGAVTTSSAITVVVIASNTPPTVSITAPANNASFIAPASISITTTAADADGTVSTVQFYNGATLLGSDATSPYSFTWTSVAAGTYTLTAKATDNAGAVTTSTAVSITVSNPVVQAPYGGTAALIPGKIEAENYDIGGQGVAFNETTAGNSGTVYRTDDVDVEATGDTGGGYNVGWIASGEWLEYTVNVASAGTYTIEVRVASANTGGILHVEMDGQNVSGAITVPNTGAWQTYQSIVVPNVSLTAGQKVMRIAMDGSWFNLNYINFTSAVSNIPPTVSITAPSNNASFIDPASIVITADAADEDGTISTVQFYNGATLLGSDVTSPYSFSWNNVGAGTYSITVKATDNAGAITTSSAVVVTVTAVVVNTPPTVSITAPANNASFTAPASVTITASATDADGTVSSVQFYNGTILLGSDATSPYSFSWTSVGVGTYSVTAVATDDSGAVTISSPVSVIVKAPNSAPTVSITAPANNTIYTAPASVTITANAADADGTISTVQFYNGATLLGSDVTSPYSFSWTNVTAGTYSLTAKATDNAGAVTTSTAVTIVVNPSAADIIGSDCGANNATLSFSLNSTNRANVTSYNWWYTGSAASTTMAAGAPYSVNVQTGPNFSAGQVCVGTNLSVAPWYKQYCKSITKCVGTRVSLTETGEEVISNTVVSPNPSVDLFFITAVGDIEQLSVVNELGEEVYHLNKVEQGQTITLGNQFNAGVYMIKINYLDGSREVKRIVKLN